MSGDEGFFTPMSFGFRKRDEPTVKTPRLDKRWQFGRVRIDLDTQPRWWREIGWHFTHERGDARWHDIRMIQVHAWRWSLAVTW